MAGAPTAGLPLAELQRRFAAALRAPDEAAPDAVLLGALRDDGLPAARRLEFYRRNVQGNFLKVLALEFPAIERLGGAAWFRQAGLDFLREHPSRSGDLHGIGAPFAGFLQRRLGTTPHAYFADVAALEWAWQECLVAPDPDGSLDVGALAGVAPQDVAALRFAPHPALRLVGSRWPVFTIWDAHREPRPDGDLPAIDLDGGGECAILRRSGAGAEARRCDPATFAWLQALAAGRTFGDAWEVATSDDAGFDVARALAEAVRLGLFCGFRA
jgi:hypothetical protein